MPGPSAIECERFGYDIIENCLFAAISVLISASVPLVVDVVAGAVNQQQVPLQLCAKVIGELCFHSSG